MIPVPVVLLVGALQLTPSSLDPGITLAATSPDAESPHSARLITVNRSLRYATLGSLIVTGALGTIAAINRGTAFTDGRCDTGEHPIFGVEWGCSSLSTVHGVSAVISTVLFTATATTSWVLGDINTAERTNVGLPRKIVGWISLVGILLQPLLGIVSRYPEIVGIPPPDRNNFSKDLRTVHIGIGYVTIAAYATAIVMDW